MIAADLGDLEVYAQITQGDIGRVKAGLQAKFMVDAFPDEPAFDGKLTDVHLMPVNVLGTNLYPAVVKVANRHEGAAADPNADVAFGSHDGVTWLWHTLMQVATESITFRRPKRPQ